MSRTLGSLTSAALVLETLSLRASSDAALPSNLFENRTPALRHLSITGMRLHWDSFSFRNLHSLTVRMVSPWPLPIGMNGPQTLGGGPTHERLLSILAQMPALRSLSLLNCLPYHTEHLPDDHSIVELRDLHHLSLGGSGLQCLNVMQSLSFSDSCTLSIEASKLDSETDIFDSILAHIAKHLRRIHGLDPIETLCLDITTLEPKLTVSCYRTAHMQDGLPHYPPPDDAGYPPPALQLRLWWQHRQPNQAALFHELIHRVFDVLPFEELCLLSLPIVDSAWTEDDWCTVVGPLATLEHVRAKGRGAIMLTHALLDHVPAEDLDAPLFLPRLASLTFDNVNFRACPNPESPNEGFFSFLPRVLAQRRALGSGLRTLVLYECNVRPGWVARLREVVPSVERDRCDDWGELEEF
ncbi:hypothetical protein K488DRAFT_86166 [Vararia minispora EC-137]|uniref:Uncharacterized protein n=1 Tax=Vararia minispora EC-137 TaxID=1314806 RepID=A0ACB8QKE3_9AGAM|nr:hypothetical protein K488DRAFT_86166 [Vararia minispora EC-137]